MILNWIVEYRSFPTVDIPVQLPFYPAMLPVKLSSPLVPELSGTMPLDIRPPTSYHDLMSQTRIIEKRGLIQFTTAERSELWLWLTIDLMWGEEGLYRNFKSNPPKTWYGTATVFQGDYVSAIVPLEFPSQTLLFKNDLMQTAELIACANNKILEGIVLLSQSLSPVAKVSDVVTEELTGLEIPMIPETAVKFVLPDDVVVQVSSQVVDVFFCGDVRATVPKDKRPNAAPARPNNNNPNNKPQPSPPYNPQNNDNGDTYVPGGNQGVGGIWTLTFIQNDCNGTPFPPYTFTVAGYANDTFSLSTTVGGGAEIPYAHPCGVTVPLLFVVNQRGENALGSGNLSALIGDPVLITGSFVPN